jgi:hypothetical protein
MSRRAGTGRSAVVLGCALALGLALTGCAKGRTTNSAAAASAATGFATVNVSVQKFKYGGFPDTLKSGNTWINFSNHETSKITHEMILLNLPSGKTKDDIVADVRKKGPDAEEDYLSFGEIGDVDTAATKAQVFSLPPGTYAIACFETGTPEGKPEGGPVHVTLGMIHQFTVS